MSYDDEEDDFALGPTMLSTVVLVGIVLVLLACVAVAEAIGWARRGFTGRPR